MSLGALTALWLARWATFPLALDPAYHLFVAQQVSLFPLALHIALAGFWLYRFLPQPIATRAAIAAGGPPMERNAAPGTVLV